MTTLTINIETFLKDRKCKLPDIGLLQPADMILNAAGEDIRRRIFMTADQRGEDMCLRPEFTIPVCLAHIKSDAPAAGRKRYGYVGKVFRQRSAEPSEFIQAGIEDIGAANAIAADARSLREAIELIRELGRAKLSVTIGDQAIFEAVLQSLGLPEIWRQRLGRTFGDPARLAGDLDRLSGLKDDEFSSLPKALQQALAAKDSQAITELVSREMKKASLASSGRNASEIATRLMAKSELAETRLTADKREILENFLTIDLSLTKADAKLWAFARRYHIAFGEALEVFHKRIIAIEKMALDNTAIRYRSGFGRRLDYYTGFVFEIRSPFGSSKLPLAGGGRYDRLLTVLGAKDKTPAIGFAVYVDRVSGKSKSGKSTSGKNHSGKNRSGEVQS